MNPKADRIALWNQATIEATKARRVGDSWDWEDYPAGFAIHHPTIGLLSGFHTRKEAEAELAFTRLTGCTRQWMETATPAQLAQAEA